MKFILGTASKYRRKAFEEMGYEGFEVMTADIDERAIRLDDPEKLTVALAKAKADVLKKRINEPVILVTADQVISWNDKIREKPLTKEEAREFLSTYFKAPVFMVNGLCVTNTRTGRQACGNESTEIIFKEIPEGVIEKIIEREIVCSWAGAFLVDDPLIKPYIDSIKGVEGGSKGLPKPLLEKLILEVS